MRVYSVQLKEFPRMERSEPIMSETHPPRRIGQSIVAVIAGMLVGIVITLGTDVVLHAAAGTVPAGRVP